MSVIMHLRTFTVLIVEDTVTDRELYQRVLGKDLDCAYDFLEADSIVAGLALCQTRSIDAVLLDYKLPDGNGLNFLEKLSAQSNGSGPTVVMISGYGDEKVAVRAIKLGAEDYLVKRDLTAELLIATIRSAIENTRLKLQLQQQEQRFRASVENMLDCFGIYSAMRNGDGQIVDFRHDYLNAAAMQSNQMTEADLSKTLCEVFPAVRETGLFGEQCQVVETGIPLVKEDLIYSDVFEGEQLTRAYNVQAAKLDDGFVASWRDITAQKQIELNLQTANQQITTIWESMTDAYLTLDRDWRIAYTNSTAAQVISALLQLPPEEIIGKTYWEAFPWMMGTIVEQEYHRAVTDRTAVHFELLYQPSETWFEIHAYPSDIGLGVYFQDIDKRKRTELARIAAEQERDRFFSLSIDLLVVVNLDGCFVRVNPACEPILGFTSAEMMAHPFIDFIHPDDIAATMAVFTSSIAGEVLVNFENRYRRKDGSYRWILWSAIFDPVRKLVYANGRDITDRKIAELNDGFLSKLLQRLRKLTDPEAIRWEAVESLGKYLEVDRSLWYEVGEGRVAKVLRDWSRDEVSHIVGEYPLDEFLSPAFQAVMVAGEPIAIADVITHPLTAAYVDCYQQVGIRAFVNIPYLDDEGRWVMTLHLNTSQTVRIWRDDEIQLMQTLVTQLWSFVAQARAVQALSVQEEKTRAAQAIVRQQLGEIEAIYQMAPVGLCFVDTDLRYVRINERLAQINGLSAAEHIGKTFREVLPEVADLIEPMYRQIIESGEPVIDMEVTGTNRAQPGVERCWLASFYPQTDDQGRVIGVNNVVLEITDRKHNEERLRQSEEFNRRILDSNRDCIKVMNLAGRLTYMNDYGRSLMEINDFSTIVRSQWIEFWQGSEQEAAQTAFNLALAGEVGQFEGYCATNKGTPKWWEVIVTPVFDADRQVSQILSVSRDISDRKIAAQRLQESEQQLRTGVEVAGMGLLRFDFAADRFEMSPEAAALYGFARDTSVVMREQLHDTFHPDERAEIEAFIVQNIDRGVGLFAHDHRIVWPNGEVRYLSVRFRLYFDRSGAVARPTHAILAAIDITDRKKTQAALEERNQELNSFVYVVSHDLKAPLRAVANLSQWIEDDLEGQLTPDNQSQMNLLRNRVQRMSSTIDGLLDYARCSRSDDEVELVEVAKLLADVIDSIDPPPTFTIHRPAELPTLFTKRSPLFQVLVNLIGNGIKHHHSEAGTIQISIEDHGAFYQFAIADDGPGIALEYQEQMFKIFQAVNPQNRSDSTGIGLAIVKKTIEAEGGTIWLESEVGKGTTFYFTWLQR